MPVEGKVLEEKGKPAPIRKQGATQRKVLVFLATHSEAGYSQREMADALRLPSGEQQARQSCLRLVALGWVRRTQIPVQTQKGLQYRIYYQVTALGVRAAKEGQ